MDAKKDRCRGALVGLAVGDALGAAVEFREAVNIGDRVCERTDDVGEAFQIFTKDEMFDEGLFPFDVKVLVAHRAVLIAYAASISAINAKRSFAAATGATTRLGNSS
jgi:hypothetical protein